MPRAPRCDGAAPGRGTRGHQARRDGGAPEHPRDLQHRGCLERVGVGGVGQRGDHAVVLVQPDRGEQRDPHHHADHPRHDDERGCRAVGVVRGLRQCGVVHRGQCQSDAQAGQRQHHRRRDVVERPPPPGRHHREPDGGQGQPGTGDHAVAQPSQGPAASERADRHGHQEADEHQGRLGLARRVHERASSGTSTTTATSATPTSSETTRAQTSRPRTRPRGTSGEVERRWCTAYRPASRAATGSRA